MTQAKESEDSRVETTSSHAAGQVNPKQSLNNRAPIDSAASPRMSTRAHARRSLPSTTSAMRSMAGARKRNGACQQSKMKCKGIQAMHIRGGGGRRAPHKPCCRRVAGAVQENRVCATSRKVPLLWARRPKALPNFILRRGTAAACPGSCSRIRPSSVPD